MSLQLLPQPPTREVTAPVERFFVVVKGAKEWGNNGWETWLWTDGERINITMRCHLGLGTWHRHKTRREAVEFGQRYAREQGFEYEERKAPSGTPPPEASREDKQTSEWNALAARVHEFDAYAKQHMGKEPLYTLVGASEPTYRVDWEQASHCWVVAAKACRDMIRIRPGQAAHLNEVTATRLDLAIDCLERLRDEVDASKPTSGLTIIPSPPSPEGGD